VKVAPEIVAALCRKHAPDLLTPTTWHGTPLDKVRLLWGIAGVESTFGFNCNPKHEDGYCYGGKYFDRDRSHSWGCLAHCSYGPWQAMFADFPLGVSPLSLMWQTDGRVAAETGLLGGIRVLNHAISHGAAGLGDIIIHYNGPADVDEYATKLSVCMGEPMPESVSPVTA
jgi:hypothetical protein